MQVIIELDKEMEDTARYFHEKANVAVKGAGFDEQMDLQQWIQWLVENQLHQLRIREQHARNDMDGPDDFDCQ